NTGYDAKRSRASLQIGRRPSVVPSATALPICSTKTVGTRNGTAIAAATPQATHANVALPAATRERIAEIPTTKKDPRVDAIPIFEPETPMATKAARADAKSVLATTAAPAERAAPRLRSRTRRLVAQRIANGSVISKNPAKWFWFRNVPDIGAP